MLNKKIHNNVLELIGNTPLVRLNKVGEHCDSEILGKVEFFNPGGSVKDRIGVAMIHDAEKKGLLKPGGTIVECTSGNTGMGLAIASAIMGYKCVFVMPDKMSMEKIKNLRAFGAKVVITPTDVEPEDPKSYYSVAKRLSQEIPNAMWMNQYDNLSNRDAHYATTGPELWNQLDGKFDAFVAGMGTGGTITGTARYLKEKNKQLQIVGVDPVGSILHEYFKTGKMGAAHSYKVEGIGEDFIPKNYDFSVIDEIIQISDKESFQMTRSLLLKEGLFVGVSCGAAVCGALKYAKTLKKPQRIVVLLPDSGNRYLSKVFDDDWMRENGFLEEGLGTVADLISIAHVPTDKEVITASTDDTVEKIIGLMTDRGVSQIPVMKGKKLEGIVSEKSLLSHLLSGKVKGSDKVGTICEKNFAVFKKTHDADALSQSLTAGQVPVVMDHDNVIAIITKIDLIKFLNARTVK